MKKTNLAIFVLCIFTVLLAVSCQKPPSGPSDKTSAAVMKSTEEYNYLLDPVQISQTYSELNAITPDPVGVSEFLEQYNAYFKEPEISGKSDGKVIILDGKYPFKDEHKAKTAIIAKLNKDKTRLPGCIKADNLIGYMKFPGPQNIFDTIIEYVQATASEEEKQQMQRDLGMLSTFVNLQEDIFKWMGPEMGVLFYTAKDPAGESYLNSAFAISINDPKVAQEKLLGLVKKAGMFMGSMDPATIFETEQYKTFTIDKINKEILPMDALMPTDPGIGVTDMQAAIMYGEDWLFLSDDYGLKQLADATEQGGALGTASTIDLYFDLDKLNKNSGRYEKNMFDTLQDETNLTPEQMAELEKFKNRFEKLKLDKEFGKFILNVNINPEDISIHMETSAATLELIELFREWYTEMMKLEQAPIETDAPASTETPSETGE